MKVVDFIIVVCCPVVITASLLVNDNVNSASVMFYQVDLKPSNLNRTAVQGRRRHKTDCTHICLYIVDCLTTVFDEDLGQCSLYNSTTMVETLSNGETVQPLLVFFFGNNYYLNSQILPLIYTNIIFMQVI